MGSSKPPPFKKIKLYKSQKLFPNASVIFKTFTTCYIKGTTQVRNPVKAGMDMSKQPPEPEDARTGQIPDKYLLFRI